jgi:putative IMPACT (imprinted ancient) family translation regulator
VGGFNPKTERCSDDGEPTGTAGVPILGAINGEDISDTVCVVVRYSGGIKLGAGGLIRAYGGTARMCLRAAEKKILIPKSTTRLSTVSSNAGQIYTTAMKHNGVVEGESYNELGDLEVFITCDTEKFQDLIDDLTDATRGNITFKDSS